MLAKDGPMFVYWKAETASICSCSTGNKVIRNVYTHTKHSWAGSERERGREREEGRKEGEGGERDGEREREKGEGGGREAYGVLMY